MSKTSKKIERRDEMIVIAMDALESKMEADAAMIFIDAAVVVDALLTQYRIVPREHSGNDRP